MQIATESKREKHPLKIKTIDSNLLNLIPSPCMVRLFILRGGNTRLSKKEDLVQRTSLAVESLLAAKLLILSPYKTIIATKDALSMHWMTVCFEMSRPIRLKKSMIAFRHVDFTEKTYGHL